MEELWLRGGEEGAGLPADRLPGSGLNGFGYLSARFSGLRAKPANKLDIKTSLSLVLTIPNFRILLGTDHDVIFQEGIFCFFSFCVL